MRSHKQILKTQIHAGAINFLECSSQSYLVTGAADKSVKVFDILRDLRPLSQMETTDAVFCGKTLDNLILVGCGDGNLLSYEAESGECLYGYGADQVGAVHCMGINDDRDCVVTGGDSGQGLLLNYI